MWKRGEILLFSSIFCCLLVDLCVKTGTTFSLRYKRLLEISEVEITRVECMFSPSRFYLQLFLVHILDITIVMVLTKPVKIKVQGSLVLHTRIGKNLKKMCVNKKKCVTIEGSGV